MNSEKIYNSIIERAKSRGHINEYTEKHHIIPRCMNGSNDQENLVLLTAREHYLAHWLLYRMHKLDEYASSLICAFRYMTVDSHGGRRSGKDYSWMRRDYGKNHPMKRPDVAAKTSAGLKTYYSNLTDEEKLAKSLHLKYIRDNESDEVKQLRRSRHAAARQKYEQNKTPEEKYAKGKKISDSLKSYYKNEDAESKRQRFEIMYKTTWSAEVNAKRSETHKQRIKSMTDEEKRQRLANSWGSCDQAAKARAISEAKKGKSTNQCKIMGMRYAAMSDEQFSDFLKTIKPRGVNRLIKMRNKYLNE